MILYTIGFTKKSAKQFFEALISNGVQMLADVRLNNHSQLAGFAKNDDLEFFLRRLGDIDYFACPDFAPTKEMLSSYRKKELCWENYEIAYRELMKERDSCGQFIRCFSHYKRICLMCSEATPEHCHRRLAAEMLLASSEIIESVNHIL